MDRWKRSRSGPRWPRWRDAIGIALIPLREATRPEPAFVFMAYIVMAELGGALSRAGGRPVSA